MHEQHREYLTKIRRNSTHHHRVFSRLQTPIWTSNACNSSLFCLQTIWQAGGSTRLTQAQRSHAHPSEGRQSVRRPEHSPPGPFTGHATRKKRKSQDGGKCFNRPYITASVPLHGPITTRLPWSWALFLLISQARTLTQRGSVTERLRSESTQQPLRD